MMKTRRARRLAKSGLGKAALAVGAVAAAMTMRSLVGELMRYVRIRSM